MGRFADPRPTTGTRTHGFQDRGSILFNPGNVSPKGVTLISEDGCSKERIDVRLFDGI